MIRRLDGGPWCPSCAARCRTSGHDYAPDGWRLCACDRSIPSHTHTPPDPAGGDGCGMTWRLCSRCDHIDERHLTEIEIETAIDDETVPGGHLRQDVPAGPALPHQDTSSEHVRSEEIAMVGPSTGRAGTAGGGS